MQLTREQLRTIAGLQYEINTLINPNWLENGNDWNRASMVEGVEMFDHIGQWKWWKSMEVHLLQGQLEMVDIFHFILSDAIDAHNGDLDAATDALYAAMYDASGDTLTVDGKDYHLPSISRLERLDLMVATFALKRPSLRLVMMIMDECELTGDQLEFTYLCKNTLNIFRQIYGYQRPGEYVKEIPYPDGTTKEDNAVMEMIIPTLDAQAPTFADDLYNAFEKEYLLRTGKAPIARG